MKQMQQKSPCCGGQVWRFGKRRRQCKVCRKTWRVWTRKRGRKCRRSDDCLLLKRYLRNHISINGHAQRRDTPSHAGLLARLRSARDTFIATTTWATVPKASSILIADAFEETINGNTITGYLGLVRACDATQAVILPPYWRQGKETSAGWEAAFATFAPQLGRTQALVCDGATGLVRQARRNEWVLQRCQFHLWHALNNYLRIPRQGPAQLHALFIHQLVRIALESSNDERVWRAICQLQQLLPTLRSRGARKVIRGFIKHWPDYRSFIYHDHLNLPRTSNCAEQTICLISRLQQSARGWNSEAALAAWAEAALKHQQTITCNPSEPTKLI